MSETSEPIAAEQENIASLSHRRILVLMGATTILSGLLGSVFVSMPFGAGVFIGGILSFVNYYWLKFSLKKIFEQAVSGSKPRLLGLRYVLRYVILGAILTIVFLTKVMPVASVILGLASFAIAIVIEGFIRIVTSFSKRKEF